jgi:hypothetical protein
MVVDRKVLLLTGFAGDSSISPLHNIVENCDAQVFESKLLRLLVQHKWERHTYPRLRILMVLYCLDVGVATTAMLSTSHGWNGSLVDTSVGAAVIAELMCLASGVRALTLQGAQRYFSSLWNIIGCFAVAAVLSASVAHFNGTAELARTAGAFGTIAKYFGLLDWLRSYRQTGPLVRMLEVIAQDITPFLLILGIATIGSALFFVINQPESDAFGAEHPIGGSLWPLVTMYRAGLGDFDVSDYTTDESLAMFCVFAGLVVILMLNLLIAIMNDSYDKVKARESVEGTMERAKMVVEMERVFPARNTSDNRFLHIAEAAEPDDVPGQGMIRDGITGRVRFDIDRLQKSMSLKIDAVDTVNANRFKQVQQDLVGVRGELSDMKSLLERLVRNQEH